MKQAAFIICLLFLTANVLDAAEGEGISASGTLSSKLYVTIDSLIIGPSINTVKVPFNGKGYMYFSFTSDDSLKYTSTIFPIHLKEPDEGDFQVEAYFVDTGEIRLTFLPETFDETSEVQLTFPEAFQIADTIYNLKTFPAFTATLDSTTYSHSWDVSSSTSGGASFLLGTIGAGVSASKAKLSVTRSNGVGLKIQIDDEGKLVLERRMENGSSVGVESPSFNKILKSDSSIKADIGGNASIAFKALVGHSFKFDKWHSSTELQKMAQAGFLLETMSIAGMGVAPTTGAFLNSIIVTLNEYGGVKPVFDSKIQSSYWGAGAEGTFGAGVAFDIGGFELKGIEGNVNLALNAKHATRYADSPQNIIGTSNEFAAAMGFNFSTLKFGIDLVGPLETEFTLFDIGAGSELSLAAAYDKKESLETLEIQLKGGGDITYLSVKKSEYYNTKVAIPGEYSSFITNAGRSIVGLYNDDKEIWIGERLVTDAVESFKDTYEHVKDKPVTVTSIKTLGSGASLGVGVGLDIGAGIGLGMSIGVSGSYFEEIEYPKLESEVYLNGRGYITSSIDTLKDRDRDDLFMIVYDMLSGTAPLIETAFMNFMDVHEQTINTLVQSFSMVVPGAGGVATLSNVEYIDGKWTITGFATETKMIQQKSFELPLIKNMYYSSDVKHKTTSIHKNATIDVETSVIIVSKAINVNFTNAEGVSPIGELSTPFEVGLILDEQRLTDNDFSIKDKDRIQMYRYDIDSLSWIQEGGSWQNDTLKVIAEKLGVFALGIELNNMKDNLPPIISDWGTLNDSTTNAYPTLFANIKDNPYGFGVDISRTSLILNGDTLDTFFNPTQNQFFYQLSSQDQLKDGLQEVTILATDFAGNEAKQDFTFQLSSTNLHETDGINGYQLEANYPNPFNTVTNFNVAIPKTTSLSINVYDITGSYVITLFSGVLQEGAHQFTWNGTNGLGNKVAGGVYFYQLQSNDINMVRKMQFVP